MKKQKLFRLIGLVLTLTMLLAPLTASVGAAPAPGLVPPALEEPAQSMLPAWAQPPALDNDNDGDWPAAPAGPDDPLDKVEPLVLNELADVGQTDFFVWMTEKADLSPAYALETREEKGRFVFETLVETAERTQKELRAYLDQQGVNYCPFYVANKILVRGGYQTLLLNVASRPDVARVTANHHFQLEEPFVNPNPLAHILAVETNISFVNADDVWALGYTGAGTVMAGNDTGLDWDHPALINQYRGWDGATADHNYNWWDATGTYPTVPGDGHGHGTHTSGTMVGDDGAGNQIGVAPGARLVHCKNMTDGGGGSDATFTECFEWDLAPWDLTYTGPGTGNPRPDLAPDAINNSWGYSGGGYPVFEDEIAALQAAGILVEVSAGNSGPSCSTLGSPGDYRQSLTTGSVNHSGGSLPGTLTGFSSRGPSSLYPSDYIPDIMAPGESIRSSLPGGAYASWSGTSMSGPHVTGLIGLMWSANPGLRGMVTETVNIIFDTAVPLTGQGGSGCGGDYTDGPNNDWGYGAIDALAAVEQAMLYGGTGTLAGTVTDGLLLAVVPDATIRATLSPTQSWQTTSGALGNYSMVVFSGTYTVDAHAYGYLPAQFSNITVISGTTTTLNIILPPAAYHVVSGYVTDATTGWPLYASIDVAGYPGDPIWNDPVTGYYSVTLAEGITYTFNVNAWVPGYNTASRDVGPLIGDETQNFALQIDTNQGCPPGYMEDSIFYDGFETGSLGSSWTTTTTNEGRVRVDTYAPYAGLYSVLLDDDTDGGAISIAGIILTQDLSAEPQVYLDFWWHEYGDENDPEDGVFISDDNGATWCQVFSFNGGPGTYQNDVVNLTAALPGCGMAFNANFQIKFQFYDNYSIPTDGYTIDEVKLTRYVGFGCTPMPGGLVVGNVYDKNTGDSLVGADVANDSGEATTTEATPDDPAVDDGFYTLFSPAGSHTFTATMTSYSLDVDTVTAVQSDTVRHDFYLPTGYLSYAPPVLEATLDMGISTTRPFTLSNSGGLAATFEFREEDRGFGPVLLYQNLPVYIPPIIVADPPDGNSYSGGGYQALPAPSGIDVPTPPARYTGSDGLVFYGDRGTFDADFPGLPVEGFENTLVADGTIVVCPGPFDSATDNACFAPGGILDGIRLMNSNPANDMVVIGDGALGNPTAIVGPNTFADDHDITFFDGDMYAVGLDLYSPIGADNFDIYIYGSGDVLLGQTTVLADVLGTFWGIASDQPITRIRTDAIGANEGELFDNIAFGGRGDVPWLSEDPISGTIASMANQVIDITFDASVPEITQPGTYYAQLKIADDTPYDLANVPVTMTVNPPATWGKLDGTVTSTGYCDVNTTTLEGAEVLVESWMTETITFTVPVDVYVENFEADDGGYTTSGTTSWAWGTPTSGPGAAHSGVNLWATNLSGSYNNNEDGYITSPDIDLSAYASQSTTLSWWQWYEGENCCDYISLEVSNDGGASWTRVYGEFHGGQVNEGMWEQQELTLDPSYSVSNFRLRFRFRSDYSVTYPGWYVDDVLITASATQQADVPVSWLLETDENGYYQVWMDEAHSPLTITVTYPDHETGLATGVTIAGQVTTTVDFDLRWLVPCLSVDPLSMEATVLRGTSETQTLTLFNDGAVSTPFEMREKEGTVWPPVLGLDLPAYVGTPREQLPGYDPNAMTTEGQLALSANPPAPRGILAAGDVLAQWPSGLALPWGTGYSFDEDTVWLSNPAAGGGDDFDHEFETDGTPTGRTVFALFDAGAWGGDIAYNPNTGMFWQVNVGGDNCIYEWDPATGQTGNSICDPAWTWTSQRGLAYDPTDDTFFIGGWNDTNVYHIDNTGTVIEQWPLGLSVSGLAYNFEVALLFIIENSATDSISVLDVASGAIVDTFTVVGFGGLVGAGLAIDCDGNLWAANQGNANAYLIDSGVPASLCGVDVPWLSEDPITGTVSADSTFPVSITFTAFPTQTSGVYTATLVVNTDDPVNPRVNVPVTMTVVHAPICDFISSSPDDLGETTIFTNTTDEGYAPTTYRWNFDDGSAVSTAEHPTHTYPLPALYTAVLTATNVYGEDVCTGTVSIEGVIGGFVSNSPVPLGAPAVFTNTTLSNPPIVQWFWTFGNSQSSADENPIHIYAEPGLYTVTLFAANVPYYYGPTNVYDIYQDTVEVLAPPYGVRIEPTTAAHDGVSAVSVFYTLQVDNTGSVAETFDVSVSGNTWTTVVPATIGPIAAGGNANLVVTVTIPSTELFGATDTANVTVASQADPVQSTIAVLTTMSHNTYGVMVAPSTDAKSSQSGTTVTYTLQVTNTGNTVDTLTMAVSGNGWVTDVPSPVGPLASGESADVQVIVHIPAGTNDGDDDTATITATSQSDGTESDASVLTTTAFTAVCTDVTSVDLSLMTTGAVYTDTMVEFSADIAPDNAAKPYTYTVDYGDGTVPVTATSSDDPLESTLDHIFANTGAFTVKIAVWNCAMTNPVTDVHEIVITGGGGGYDIYLPLVLRNH